MIGILLFSAMASIGQGPPLDLKRLADRAQVKLGSCVKAELLREGGPYAEGLGRAVNMIEPENDLKPATIWTGPTQYDFTNSDFLIGAPGKKGWAQANGMTVRGHVLLYPQDQGYTSPRWILDDESHISSDQARKMLRDYIQAVAGRYRGKVAMWDVVNEAIDTQPNSRPFNLRDSFWLRKLGPNFLVDAFNFAHKADPGAKLYYNDFDFEEGNWKTDAIFKLLDFLRKEGATVDGLGFQYHLWLGTSVKAGDGHERTFKRTQEAKLDFMITELDVSLPVVPYPKSDPRYGQIPQKPELLDQQAELYGDLFQMALGFPNCKGIQLWGFTDAHSWISEYQPGKGAALDFDANYAPKPAAFAIAKVLAKLKK